MPLADIQARIAAACEEAGRTPDDVTLIAVSKVQPEARVVAVLEEGHRIFGENKVQEAAGKWPAFRERYEGVELHLIGPLQTNKAKQAMQIADAIHTLDRMKLATTIARHAQDLGHCPSLFIQVNTGEEAQKSGVLPAEADAFIADVRKLDLPEMQISMRLTGTLPTGLSVSARALPSPRPTLATCLRKKFGDQSALFLDQSAPFLARSSATYTAAILHRIKTRH